MTLIDSIYVNVHALEDMEFLVQYASKVLPHEPSEATGERVWQNILDLQDELIQKREVKLFRSDLKRFNNLMFRVCLFVCLLGVCCGIIQCLDSDIS